MSQHRRRFVFLLAFMSMLAMAIGGITTAILYNSAVNEQQARLVDIRQSFIRLIDSVADLKNNEEAEILNHLQTALSQAQSFGKTGELVIAKNYEGRVVFVFGTSKATTQPDNRHISIAMKRALAGYTGFTEGLDYAGDNVAAAYSPVAELGWGLVAKIDTWEIRRPYVVAALISIGIALLILGTGIFFFFRISNPVLDDLASSQARNHAIVAAAVDAIITIDTGGTIESVNPAVQRLFGYQAHELVGQNVSCLMPAPFSDEHDGYIDNYLQSGIGKVIGIGREVPCKKKNGEIFTAYLAINELMINNETKFIGTLHDLSSLKQAEHEVKELSHRIIEVQEEERDRISRELHDDLGTSLFLLKMQIQSTFDKIKTEISNDEFNKNSQSVLATLGEIVESTRALSHRLRPIGLKDLGLSLAIDKLLDRFEESSQVTVIRDYSQLDDTRLQDWDINIYRIVQEAINNISKHAQATSVSISCEYKNGLLLLRIKDNGLGIDSDDPNFEISSGLGLTLMRERAELMGARLQIVSQKEKGTEVLLEFKSSERV